MSRTSDWVRVPYSHRHSIQGANPKGPKVESECWWGGATSGIFQKENKYE
jgi:hypothetical protein